MKEFHLTCVLPKEYHQSSLVELWCSECGLPCEKSHYPLLYFTDAARFTRRGTGTDQLDSGSSRTALQISLRLGKALGSTHRNHGRRKIEEIWKNGRVRWSLPRCFFSLVLASFWFLFHVSDGRRFAHRLLQTSKCIRYTSSIQTLMVHSPSSDRDESAVLFDLQLWTTKYVRQLKSFMTHW